jgi:hypothetical protein
MSPDDIRYMRESGDAWSIDRVFELLHGLVKVSQRHAPAWLARRGKL